MLTMRKAGFTLIGLLLLVGVVAAQLRVKGSNPTTATPAARPCSAVRREGVRGMRSSWGGRVEINWGRV